MTTEVHPRTYTCPKCAKVHAADLSAMEGHPEIHGKVHCMECHVMLWLSIGEDGRTKCELFEAHLHEVKEAKAEQAEEQTPRSAEAAPSAASSSGFLSILIAAVVAAVVSFLVSNAAGTSAAPASDDTGKTDTTDSAGAMADTTALEERLQALQTMLDTTTGDARAEHERLAKAQADLMAKVQGNTEALTSAPAVQAQPDPALAAALAKIAADYKTLNGRIEANYTQLRMIKKSLKKPEGK
jgi:hypothetical protein